ncbi:MAG: hypothetical protein ACXW12_17710 [Burkholderiales bacterium]
MSHGLSAYTERHHAGEIVDQLLRQRLLSSPKLVKCTDRASIARPTMFSVAHAAGLPTYMFVGKAKLKHLLSRPSDAELKVAGFQGAEGPNARKCTLRARISPGFWLMFPE